MLAGSPAASLAAQVLEGLPELLDAVALTRALHSLTQRFPGQEPLALLASNPGLLLQQGESDMEDSAEYGELSTKD